MPPLQPKFGCQLINTSRGCSFHYFQLQLCARVCVFVHIWAVFKYSQKSKLKRKRIDFAILIMLTNHILVVYWLLNNKEWFIVPVLNKNINQPSAKMNYVCLSRESNKYKRNESNNKVNELSRSIISIHFFRLKYKKEWKDIYIVITHVKDKSGLRREKKEILASSAKTCTKCKILSI